ncbi:MAG: glycosyltransferase [Deltaproteobacteria bacterium]|nr:glycosyltransferase [Deltaproteobacteria bacterium]
MWPDAPIYTSIVDYGKLLPELKGADIRPSWMQKLPGVLKRFKMYLPFYAGAIESFDLGGYDIIISSSSAFAKGAKKGKGALHVCYCYTPMRFVWDFDRYTEKETIPFPLKYILPFFIRRLKKWDIDTKDRPDYYIAISTVVQKRIKAVYGADSAVIFPPVEAGRFKPSGKAGVEPLQGEFYLIVSRLNAYKCIDIAIAAFNKLKLPLVIAGEGDYKDALQAIAGPTIKFVGHTADNELDNLYSTCKALIFPGEEDFGLTPLEANAAGRPVIAFMGGGTIDTVIHGQTGLFFKERSADSLMESVTAFESGKYKFDTANIRAHALGFDRAVFARRMRAFVEEKYREKGSIKGV